MIAHMWQGDHAITGRSRFLLVTARELGRSVKNVAHCAGEAARASASAEVIAKRSVVRDLHMQERAIRIRADSLEEVVAGGRRVRQTIL